MNVLAYELRRNLPSACIWGISLGFFGCICIQLFDTFFSQIGFFEAILSAYSPEMLKALGAELSTIKTLPGFYSFCFMYVVLCAAFQALHLGLHIIGKEMAGKSAEFLYTKPMSRRKILTNKLICAILCLLAMNVIYSTATIIMANSSAHTYDAGLFMVINSSMLLTQLLFLSLGFLCACILPKIKSPLTLATGIVSAFFLLQMIVNLEPDGILSYISFLNYVSADTIMAHGGFEPLRLCILCLVSLGFFLCGYQYFQHRDIHSS